LSTTPLPLARHLSFRLVLRQLPLLGLLIALVALTWRLSAVKMLWFDELFTLHLSRWHSPGELWGHLADGVDLNPPFSYLLTHLSVRVFGETPEALRLPALLGVLACIVCMHSFAARRVGWLWACVPVALLLGTAAAPFAGEARPYGIVLGLVGLALVLWQRACERDRPVTPAVVGLGVVLVLLLSTHYYSVLVLIPLACAEIARAGSRRRLDVPVVLAVTLPLGVLGAYLPLVGQARTYAAGFWCRPSLMSLEQESGQFLTGMGLALFAFFSLVGLFAAARPAVEAGAEGEAEGYRLEERVLMAGFLATPAVGVLLGLFATGAFTWRYALFCTVGLSLLLGYVARQATGARPAAAWVLLGLCFALGAARMQFTHQREARLAAEYREVRALLDRRCQAGERVVIGDPSLYVKMAHYGAGQATPVFAASLDLPRKHDVTDAADRALLALQPLAGLDIIDFDQFADGPGPVHVFMPLDWTKRELAQRGHRLRPVAKCSGGTLYRLTRTGLPPGHEGGRARAAR
jgi:hypothetical protein